MTTTIGSLDLNAFSDLYSDSTQYFWFESNASATYGAGAHITLVPDTSFISNPTGQNILINTDGFSIRNGLLPMMTLDNNSLGFNIVDTTAGTYTTTATFASTGAQIGQSSESHLVMDYHSFQLMGRNETAPYFWVSDLRDKNDSYRATITAVFIGDGQTTRFLLGVDAINTAYTVSVSDDSGGTISKGTTVVNFEQPPTKGATITVVYKTTSVNAKAYTLGKRSTDSSIAPMSFAEGVNTEASGYASHAEGIESKASGQSSHAEGKSTTASGAYSHAEGDRTTASNISSHAEGILTTASGAYSHAEGDNTEASEYNSHAEGSGTIASGQSSHAEGNETEANGTYSHAGGNNTVADGANQTVIGKYNSNKPMKNAFEIGNGSADDARSNAFTVDWDGDVCLALDTTATTGTDYELYSAITALGWQSDVIV